MPSREVADAVQNRLATYWTATTIVDYDTVAEPPDVNAFLVHQYPVVNGTHPVLGRTFFEEGAIRLVLNVERGIGLVQGLTWCDSLKLLFRDVVFDGVQTFTPSGPVIDDNTEEGNWISYSLIVPYRYEYTSEPFSV